MRIETLTGLICMSALLSPAASATQWGYPLTSLPSGWIASQYWTFDSNGASLHFNGYWSYGSYYTRNAWMVTETFEIPSATEETVIEFDHDWYNSAGGSGSGAEYYSSIRVQYSINGETQPDLLHYYVSSQGNLDGASGFPNRSGSEHFVDTLDTSPGDHVLFVFHGCAIAGSLGEGSASTTLDWEISDFLLTAYDGQALQPSTWAGIKSSASGVTEPE